MSLEAREPGGPEPRPGLLEIAAYKGGAAEAPGAKRRLRLASNENPLGPSPLAVEAARRAAAELHRYPDGHSTALREALAAHEGIDPDRIVCGAGSDEIISLLCRAYAGPGDEVLYSAHGFLMYAISARTVGARPVAAPERDLTADVEALLALVTPATRLVFLANPNNPTGSYLSAADVRRLHAGLPENVLLVLDLAYAEYVRRNDYDLGFGLVEAHENVVVTRTFSKIHGLAALRLGWAYCPPAVADVLNRIRPPFNVNAVAQAAGLAALADEAHVERSVAENERARLAFLEGLGDLGLEAAPSVGNFVIVRFPDPAGAESGAEARRVLDGLAAAGVLVRGMAGYGLPDWLRVSLGTAEDMAVVVEALAKSRR